MIRTRVGYAGGAAENPTYRDIGSHSETIQVDYDPAQITYQELLDVFWTGHSSNARPWSQQYASKIFYHNDEQERLAKEAREQEAAKYDTDIYTEIVPFTEFYMAEGYHQKYRLQQVEDLAREFRAIYPDEKAFANSTAAARVNGYLGGHGTLAQLQAELDDLGLSPAGREKLLEIVTAFQQ